MCIRCGKETGRKGIYCSECAEKMKKYQHETRRWCIENHICMHCLKEKTFGNEHTCLKCRTKIMLRKSNTSEEQRKKDNESSKKSHKKTYNERIANNLCTCCGKRPPETGKRKCRICLEKDNAIHRRIRYKGVREYREENNLCRYCGKPIDVKNSKLCNTCLEKCEENGKKSSGKGNEIFRAGNEKVFLKP